MMKTKFLLTLLAIFMCFTLVFSPCVFADEYDLYDDDDFEEMYDDEYEDYDDYDADFDSEIPDAIFYFFYFVFLILLPLAGAIVGIGLSRSEKRKYPRYWLIFSGICFAWMLVAFILWLIIL